MEKILIEHAINALLIVPNAQALQVAQIVKMELSMELVYSC